MEVLYFDCFSGISGDMTLGALIDLGIDNKVFLNELEKLNLKGYTIEINKIDKNGIFGTDVNVVIWDEYNELVNRIKTLDDEMILKDQLNSHHEHTHNENNIDNDHKHVHHSRNLMDIELLIDLSNLNDNVKKISKMIFNELAKAEAKVHNKDIKEVHFHEVGAVDSIVDIVGVSICLDLLNIKRIYSSVLHDGQGFIECQHGKIPVPVPAVMEMLSGSNIPLVIDDVNTEMITPTGMAIIKSIAKGYGKMPEMIIEKVGYGFGKRDTGRLNALKVIKGISFDKDSIEKNEVVVLETNIDNTTSEIIGYIMEKIMKIGALDVFCTPIFMKKNRPAFKMSIITNIQNEDKIVELIFKETYTLGVRRNIMQRYVMDREMEKVKTEYGEIDVKVATKGEIKKYTVEFEDAKYIAEKNEIPIIDVYNKVLGNLYFTQS